VGQDKDYMKLIEEYVARETDVMKKILKRLPEKDRVSPLDFYPELKVRNPYTQYGLTISGKPVWVLLPYFANIIVGVDPHLSEREFKAKYGLGIDQLLQLQREGKVSLILIFPFFEKISDYLLPLYEEGLKNRSPTNLRINDFGKVVGGPQAFFKWWDEGEKLFRGKLKNIAKEIRKPWESVSYVERSLKYICACEYALLKGFGYDRISEHIKTLMKIDPRLAYVAVKTYGTFLVDPTIFSLDGIHLVDEYDVLALKYIIKHGGSLPAKKPKSEVFPFEIGKSLIDKAKLVVPNSIEGALDYYKDFEKARRALAELEMAVYEIEEGKLIDKKRALEEAWREVESIEIGAKRASEVITTLGIVGSVIGGALGSLPGLLGGLFGGLVSTDFISRPLGEKISKIGRSNHIVFVYDFVKSARKSRGD